MKIVEDEGFCTACGRFTEYNYGVDNFSLLEKNLDNYKKYKDIYVFKCRNCGFVSTDITAEEGVLCGPVKNTYEYNNVMNYAYLNGLDEELYDNHSADVPANLYEAYSLVCLESKNYEALIRTLNKSIELKNIMLRKYKFSQDELGGEEENDDDYERLYNLIRDSIKTNMQQIDYYYDFVENKNVFLKLLYLENQINLGQKATALKEYLSIAKKVKLEQDLKNYFEQLLSIN